MQQNPFSLKSQSFSDDILKQALAIYQRTGDADLMNKYIDNASKLSKPSLANVGRDLVGSKPVQNMVAMSDDANRLMGGSQLVDDLIGKVPLGKGGGLLTKAAGTGVARFAGRALPILGGVQAIGDVGDIVLGDDSLGNKVMDAAGMGIGGTIGGILGLGNPLLAAGGASLGKAASDGIQFLVGGGKSKEQQRLEEALEILNSRQAGPNIGNAYLGAVGGLPGAIMGANL